MITNEEAGDVTADMGPSATATLVVLPSKITVAEVASRIPGTPAPGVRPLARRRSPTMWSWESSAERNQVTEVFDAMSRFLMERAGEIRALQGVAECEVFVGLFAGDEREESTFVFSPDFVRALTATAVDLVLDLYPGSDDGPDNPDELKWMALNWQPSLTPTMSGFDEVSSSDLEEHFRARLAAVLREDHGDAQALQFAFGSTNGQGGVCFTADDLHLIAAAALPVVVTLYPPRRFQDRWQGAGAGRRPRSPSGRRRPFG